MANNTEQDEALATIREQLAKFADSPTRQREYKILAIIEAEAAKRELALLDELDKANEEGIFIDGTKTPSQMVSIHRQNVRQAIDLKRQSLTKEGEA